MIKKDYINFFFVRSPFSLKNGQMRPQQFFAVSSENTAFFKKIVSHENTCLLIYDKKGYVNFSVRWTHAQKYDHAPHPKKIFSPFSRKILPSSKKLLDEKIFKTSFSIEKVVISFS